MARDNRLVISVYAGDGSPLPGLTPVWTFCTNLDESLSVVPPNIEDIGNGVYLVTRLSVGHVVGQIDFGVTAVPRYATYDVNPYSILPYAEFTSIGETDRPVIYSVSTPRRNQVIVTFSEAVKMTAELEGALNPDNYEIPNLTVLSVKSLSDRQVLLTTTTQLTATTYRLTVYNVEDLFGNPISPL